MQNNIHKDEGHGDESYVWKEGSSFFKNGVTIVDFVLVWDGSSEYTCSEKARKLREEFEKNLKEEGLELEYDQEGEDPPLYCVKIHATMDVLKRYSEIMKMPLPIKNELCRNQDPDDDNKSIVQKHMFCDEGVEEDCYQKHSSFRNKRGWLPSNFIRKYIYVDEDYFPHIGFRYTTLFSRDKEYLFDFDDNIFPPIMRSRIVYYILDRTMFEDTSLQTKDFGINRLISFGAYAAAYPLHDGNLTTSGSMRHTLLKEWASLRKWYRYQPLDYIKDYFGVKVGLYFCWLGFYTCMLLPAAIIGLIVFLLGYLSSGSGVTSQEVCDSNNLIMCPLCEVFCDFWDLKTSCTSSRIISLVDNNLTPLFAAIMSIWAVLFLELWKRYSAEVTHRWDLTGYDTSLEVPRPQYIAKLHRFSKVRRNSITGNQEKQVPFWSVRFPATVLSFSVVGLLILVAVAACFGVIVYRMAMSTASSLNNSYFIGVFGTTYSRLVINLTAGVLNLLALVLLTSMYDWLAVQLTEMEMVRTQTEFEDSLTFKMYLLQFVNYYASIFYLAFIKGKFIGYPGHYNKIFGSRLEECDANGCLFEVTVQLTVIMVGKQIVFTVVRLIYPAILASYRLIKQYGWKILFKEITGVLTPNNSQWYQDWFLEDINLFTEYLEMVLQYGFVTIFATAFPLAPLCALINNLIEGRLDGRKMLMFYRRPVARRVNSIGVWLTILNTVSQFAVFTNALIIAFTSEFIPQFMYKTMVSDDYSLRGYVNHSLSYFDIKDLDGSPPNSNYDIKYCRYKDYREPPWSSNKYETTTMYWAVLVARLLFVLVFENIVISLVAIIAFIIPDVPKSLKRKIRRENYIVNTIIIDQARNSRSWKRHHLSCEYPDDDDSKDRSSRGNGNIIGEGSTEKWTRDFSVPPKDEALVHRPANIGEIFEVQV